MPKVNIMIVFTLGINSDNDLNVTPRLIAALTLN